MKSCYIEKSGLALLFVEMFQKRQMSKVPLGFLSIIRTAGILIIII